VPELLFTYCTKSALWTVACGEGRAVWQPWFDQVRRPVLAPHKAIGQASDKLEKTSNLKNPHKLTNPRIREKGRLECRHHLANSDLLLR
jgi:hypothetical protein